MKLLTLKRQSSIFKHYAFGIDMVWYRYGGEWRGLHITEPMIDQRAKMTD
mgnify:CR=1 FL=1